jgi:putative membrane protein
MVSLSRQLPAQNVFLAAIIIAFFAAGVETLGALTGIPFGPFIYTDSAGPQLFHPLPVVIPLVWIMAILSSRGVGRIMLRPWRKTRAYGYWLMGVTATLVVFLDVGLEPFASRVKHYWLWHPTKLGLDWYGAPLPNFLGWAVTVLIILAFVTPALINKKPAKHPRDYLPLIIWLLFNIAFAAGSLSQGLWTAAIVILIGSVVVTTFAVRGARW